MKRLFLLCVISLIQACGGGLTGGSISTHPTQRGPVNAPEIMLQRNDKNQLIVNWKLQDNVQNYVLSISTSKSFEISKTTEVSVNNPPYIIQAEDDAQQYYIKLQSSRSGRKSPDSNHESYLAPPLKPINFTGETTENESAKLQWGMSDSVDNYQLYRSANNSIGNAEIIDDNVISPYEDLSTAAGNKYFYWLAATNAGQISEYSAVISIEISQPVIQEKIIISISDSRVNEDDGNVVIIISLDKPSLELITVEFSTEDRTAIASEDYVSSSGTITFNPSQTKKTLSIEILNDALVELDEELAVKLSSPSDNALLTQNHSSITIVNDDNFASQVTISSGQAIVDKIAGKNLPKDGVVHAYISIDNNSTENSRVEIFKTDMAYEFTANNLLPGVHDFKVEIEFRLSSGAVVPLTIANKQSLFLGVTDNSDKSIRFDESDYALIDTDSDGFSNLNELATGTDINQLNYSINGSVYGMADGFSLQLNGRDVEIDLSGERFQLTTGVAIGGNYDVSIKSSGEMSDRNCTINNGSGIVSDRDINDLAIYCLNEAKPQFPLASNWNDYVVESELGEVTLCSGDESGGYYSCIHSGLRRVVDFPGLSSCAGLIATDTRNLLQWGCLEKLDGSVQIYSIELIEGAGLTNVIDTLQSPLQWKNIAIEIKLNEQIIATTKTSVWWSNVLYAVEELASGDLSQASGIYVITSDHNQKLVISANKIGLLISEGATLTGVVADENKQAILASNLQFLWIEGDIKSAKNNHGIYFDQVNASVINASKISDANGNYSWSGLYIDDSSTINPSMNNLIRSSIFDNNSTQINVTNSTNNTFSHILAINGKMGINLKNSHFNVMYDVRVFNMESRGVLVQSSRSNIFTDVISASNLIGLWVLSGYNIFSNVTVANNSGQGMATLFTDGNKIRQTVVINNGGDGLLLTDSLSQTISDVASLYNGNMDTQTSYGIKLEGGQNYFTGLLNVSNNAAGNCNSSGNDDGLIDVTCTNTGLQGSSIYDGSSSNAKLNIDPLGVGAEFIAKASMDIVNSSNDGGSKSLFFLSDWANFENRFRGWGSDGSVFVSDNNRGKCMPIPATTLPFCQIWDWRLIDNDSHLRNITAEVSTGNDFFKYIQGAEESSFLNHAVERMEDRIGNENTLCESGEHCIFSPNIGRYQGDGALILKQAAEDFVDGVLFGITMWEYSNNGVMAN